MGYNGMTEKISTKLSEEGQDFLKRLRNNRRKIGIDEEDLYYWQLIELIEKFFKLDNDAYLRLVKMEENK